MLQRLLNTRDDISLTILRIVLAVCIFPHGAQKMLGWFNGPGLARAIDIFSRAYHIPPALTVLAVCAEFVGAIFLVLGLLGRFGAFGVFATMCVAAVETYTHTGNFFMNWFGAQKGEGIEYHLLALAISFALVIRGSGAFSLDRLLSTIREPNSAKLQLRTNAQSA